MLTIQFNEQESQAVLRLFDLAVKAGGIAVATDAVILMQKFAQAEQAMRQAVPLHAVKEVDASEG